ncbi:MAG: DUF2809 domain-containing protein [Planctomycetes bacterium]|nr:DUF2809 domain-containing protein [Planctomycetota bacterium]
MVVGLGLGSRSGHPAVPVWLAVNAGDALWTVCAFLGCALVLPAARTRTLFALALVVSFAVEASQLCRAEWLETLRGTWPGRLLLGYGWQWSDLPRYAAGALLAAAVDVTGWARRRDSTTR